MKTRKIKDKNESSTVETAGTAQRRCQTAVGTEWCDRPKKKRLSGRTGTLLMVIGIAFLIAAIGLMGYNIWQNRIAEQNTEQVMQEMVEMISADADSEEIPAVKMVDGYNYIGYLSIPDINRMLPVMEEWDNERLRLAPCRQYGSVDEDNLVIAAHNFDSHFGRLKELTIGSEVAFTDMTGKRTEYEVAAVDIFMPQDVEKVKNSAWDLVLYTCTPGGKSRVIIGCNKRKE